MLMWVWASESVTLFLNLLYRFQGGKWVITMKSNPQLLDRCWSWLAMALVGEQLDERDEICGAGTPLFFPIIFSLTNHHLIAATLLTIVLVVSVRHKIDRIQVWTRSKDNVEVLNSIAKKLDKLLDLGNEPTIGLEFQVRSETLCPSLSIPRFMFRFAKLSHYNRLTVPL